jgi:hypothetical protein
VGAFACGQAERRGEVGDGGGVGVRPELPQGQPGLLPQQRGGVQDGPDPARGPAGGDVGGLLEGLFDAGASGQEVSDGLCKNGQRLS